VNPHSTNNAKNNTTINFKSEHGHSQKKNQQIISFGVTEDHMNSRRHKNTDYISDKLEKRNSDGREK